MKAYRNLENQKIGDIIVLELSKEKLDTNGTTRLWKCQCKCGNILYKSARHLNEANNKNKKLNCGCENYVNLAGKKFGDLTVIKQIKDKNKGKMWLCKCKCGDIFYRHTTYIHKFPYKCIREIKDNTAYRHNIKNTFWQMKQRCTNPNDPSYKNYGGRGITICDDWLNDTDLFVDWAIENGYKKGLTIDRIDNNGNYCPENCRWVDMYVQANNKRDNILVTYNDKTKSLRAWCRELQLPYRKTHKRYVMYGWSIERCFAEKERIGFK
jgi:hypothetical protein